VILPPLVFPALTYFAIDIVQIFYNLGTRNEHNMWHYLYFIVLIKVKDPTEFTGPESYVYEMVKVGKFGSATYDLRSISPNDTITEQHALGTNAGKQLY
jgi:hypothetical protein